MTHGFDLNSPLVCEGIVGDGCGGGRIFYVQNERLYAYDPFVAESMLLLENVLKAQKVTKEGCILTIECQNEVINFDLSALSPSA